MAAKKEEFGTKKAPKIGNVHYHPFQKPSAEYPFGLYIEGNPLFRRYDNVPLTVFELTQRTISTAANNFEVPVWIDFCINTEGVYLPFCSSVSGLPDGFEVPVVLNGKLLCDGDELKLHTQVWPAIIHLPHEDSFIKKDVKICYERGSIISASDVYGF